MRHDGWKIVCKAVIKKELLEVFKSMKGIMILCILTSNTLHYMTMQEVINAVPDAHDRAIQLGGISFYMAGIVILFMGHTLIQRFIYEERKAKTIHVLFAAGMDKTAIWAAKIVVTVLICSLLMFLTLLANFFFVLFYLKISIKYTVFSSVLTFFTVPILCYGILAMISVAYWYFKDMNVFGMIFPILSYLGIWNLSLKLAGVFVPRYLIVVSLLIGILLFAFSFGLIKNIHKEKIIGIGT